MIVGSQSFHTFIEAAVEELSQSKASDVLEVHSPSEPNLMCRVALEILNRASVKEVVKERLNDHAIVEGSASVGRVDDMFHIFIVVDFKELNPGNNHFRAVLPQFLTSRLLYIVMREDIPIRLEELICGQDVFLKVSR